MNAKQGNSGRRLSRFGLGLGIAICFTWSQACGWAVTGRMLADDGARRNVAATSSTTAAADLKKLQDERAGIELPKGETRAGLEGKLKLERTRTSDRYKDGDGPTATGIKDKIALFDRAAKLDNELIPAALKALQGAPAVAGGEVDVAVPVGIAQRLGWVGDDKAAIADAEKAAHFWFIVFLVFACAFFATFGFKFVGVTHEEIFERRHLLFRDKPVACVPLVFLFVEAGMNATYGWHRAGGGFFNPEAWLQAMMFSGAAVIGAYLPTRWNAHDAHPQPRSFDDDWEMQWGPRQLAHPGAADTPAARRPAAPEDIARQVDEFSAGGQSAAGGRARAAQPPAAPHAGTGIAYPASSSTHLAPQQSAPITINVGSPAAQAAESKGQVPMLPSPGSVAGARSAPGADAAGGELPVATETGPPVDRSGYRRISDTLLLFKAKELEPHPDGYVSASDMYARYVAWATARVIPEAAFLELFREVAEIPTEVIGNQIYFVGYAIRGTYPRLVDVAS